MTPPAGPARKWRAVAVVPLAAVLLAVSLTACGGQSGAQDSSAGSGSGSGSNQAVAGGSASGTGSGNSSGTGSAASSSGSGSGSSSTGAAGASGVKADSTTVSAATVDEIEKSVSEAQSQLGQLDQEFSQDAAAAG